jgi:hypothetical protein
MRTILVICIGLGIFGLLKLLYRQRQRYEHKRQLDLAKKRRSLQTAKPRKELGQTRRVRFNPKVTIGNAGGRKEDRYNPDLKSCVSRNSSLAIQVGGAKQLAKISLVTAS